jgi:sigma-B regulation protein RsbU (phosphoserine phosphatase)
MALGISADAEFTTETASLHDGDLLTLYSDGVTEAQNTASELFDERRLEECLTDLAVPTAAAAGAEVLARVMAFQGEAPQFDDITLLCLRFTTPVTASFGGGQPVALLASSVV